MSRWKEDISIALLISGEANMPKETVQLSAEEKYTPFDFDAQYDIEKPFERYNRLLKNFEDKLVENA